MKKIILLFAAVFLGNAVSAQVVDFTGIEINTESKYYKKEKKPLKYYAMAGLDLPISNLRAGNHSDSMIDGCLAPSLTLGLMGKKFGAYSSFGINTIGKRIFLNFGAGVLYSLQEDRSSAVLVGVSSLNHSVIDDYDMQYGSWGAYMELGYMRSRDRLTYGGKMMICPTKFAIAPCLFVGYNFGK